SERIASWRRQFMRSQSATAAHLREKRCRKANRNRQTRARPREVARTIAQAVDARRGLACLECNRLIAFAPFLGPKLRRFNALSLCNFARDACALFVGSASPRN